MIVGPVAVGKSSLMNEVVAQNNEFGRVSGFTSRAARPNDEPGLYRYVSDDQAQNLIQSQNTVQYAVHPTTGAIYGTQLVDYPKHYNMLDTLANVVDELRTLPFEQTITVSLTTDPDAWTSWLMQRYPNPSDERTKRLKEAILSIEWSLGQTTNHYWLVNQPNQLNRTAERLIQLVQTTPAQTEVPPEAKKLLNIAISLLSYN